MPISYNFLQFIPYHTPNMPKPPTPDLPQIQSRLDFILKTQNYPNAIQYLMSQLRKLHRSNPQNSNQSRLPLVSSRISRTQSHKCFGTEVRAFQLGSPIQANSQLDQDSFCKKLEQEIHQEQKNNDELLKPYNAYQHRAMKTEDILQGSGISFVQDIINGKWRNAQKQKQKQSKGSLLDLRVFQQTLQTYHQALGKSVQMVEKLCEKYSYEFKILNLQHPYPQERIHSFWAEFDRSKKECKTFEELMKTVKDELCHKFLHSLYTAKRYLPTQCKAINLREKQFVILPFSHKAK